MRRCLHEDCDRATEDTYCFHHRQLLRAAELDRDRVAIKGDPGPQIVAVPISRPVDDERAWKPL